jgi:glycosyltransferase involved in cell wall biosynthesis
MMHVLLITQYFPPEIGAAATRWGDYVQILIQKGHRVTVLCEMPNYPLGSYFPGYKRQWVKREKVSPDLTIIRSFAWANNRSSAIKKLGHYLIFMLSGIINAFKLKNYDVLIISSPPLFVGVIGAIISKIKSIHFILDIRDLWPESVIVLGEVKSNWIINLGKKLESFIYSATKGYIFSVPGFKKHFTNHYPDQLTKPMINLINGVSNTFFDLAQKYDRIPEKRFTVLYSGNMGLAQGLESVIKAADILQKYPIDFKFVGSGVKRKELITKTEKLGLKNVVFLPVQKKEELIKLIKKASVCLVPLKNDPLFRNAIPSKMFEYMACGRPVIASISGEVEKILNSAKSGAIAMAEDANSVADSILYYYNNRGKIIEQGQNGVTYVKQNVRKEVLISHAMEKMRNAINKKSTL